MAFKAEPAEGETISYEKRGPRWIAVSGTLGDRIFYRKSILTCGDAIWNDVSIAYPAIDKEKYDALVAHVSARLSGELKTRPAPFSGGGPMLQFAGTCAVVPNRGS
jgi:hypothetical protein